MPARVCCGQCHLAMLYATCPIVELAWLQKGTPSGRTTKPRFGVPSDVWTALLRCWSNVRTSERFPVVLRTGHFHHSGVEWRRWRHSAPLTERQ